MFFKKPTQVMFLDTDSDGSKNWIGGIGYRDEIICGCCGNVFKVSELLKDNSADIVRLSWENISKEIICGDE